MDQIKATLPVDGGDLRLDPKIARALGEDLAGDYCFAEPFPHIVIDDFLPKELAEAILQNFPQASSRDKRFEDGYTGLHKRQVFPGDCSAYHRNLFGFFNSAPVLQFLEGLTTIQGLVSDPYFDGGGYHEISTGGKLGIHADFRVNERLHLQRRLNMLIYLNKDWQPEWGGELELWDRQMQGKAKGVAPLFNRCVVFSTDATSFHGHPDPLACPLDVTRKSIALYYYTGSKGIYEEVPANSTDYRARPTDDAAVRAEARRQRRGNQMKDWLPPILLRGLRRIREGTKG
ncbi:2OG-Fe(II) oxygenase [Roseateles sp. NT4]|uniref:2OG-Fe(II) oxygenase n=1 Tax=Roseateles sp. NT4 TaxID=3453715 RepID=UPI003EEC8B13